MKRSLQGRHAWLWLAAWAVSLAPLRAHAFGGLWASQGARTEQTSARVILVRGLDRATSAIVQLALSGEASRMAWLVPLPGEVQVSLSSSTVFERLQAVTVPQYWVEQAGVHDCMREAQPKMETVTAPTVSTIQVVRRAVVGPYDYADLTVDASTPDTKPVTDWLQREGFEVRGDEDERLLPYLREGWHVLAFRIAPDASRRELRPLLLRYESDELRLPLAAAGAAELDLRTHSPERIYR